MKKPILSANTFKAQVIKTFVMMTAVLSVTTSCTQGGESDLKVLFPGGTTYAVPSTATSCASLQAGDIQENSFAYRNVTLSWANTTDSVYIIAMKLEFKSPNLANGGYSCTITGDELGMVFASGVTPWDGTLYNPPSAGISGRLSITNTCNLKCGNVQWPDGTPLTTVMGTVTVVGIQRSASGDEKPVKGTAQVKLNFGGL